MPYQHINTYLCSSFCYNSLSIIHVYYVSSKYIYVYVLNSTLYIEEQYIISFLFCS